MPDAFWQVVQLFDFNPSTQGVLCHAMNSLLVKHLSLKMKQTSMPALALAALSLGAHLTWAAPAGKGDIVMRSGTFSPKMPIAPGTISGDDCQWWWDNDDSDTTCWDIVDIFADGAVEKMMYWVRS